MFRSRTYSESEVVNGIQQRVLDFVPVTRSNTVEVEGQGRSHVRLSKLSLTLNVRASVVKQVAY